MPEMDGFTALKEIRGGRAGARAQEIWIIELTADARDAMLLARLLRLDDIVSVTVPSVAQEAARDLVRARSLLTRMSERFPEHRKLADLKAVVAGKTVEVGA